MPPTFEDLVSKKVPLEFGNPEHIRIIDEMILAIEKQKEAREAKKASAGVLKYYRVTLHMSCAVLVDMIQAYDESGAREKVADNWDRNDLENFEVENEDVEVIGIVPPDKIRV